MRFMCIDCEFHFWDEVDGDGEERMCYECLEKHYETEDEISSCS